MFSARPGRQNGAQPLVTPVSPGRHAELTAGETTVTTAIGAAVSAATARASFPTVLSPIPHYLQMQTR
jgi:hypothetical protein